MWFKSDTRLLASRFQDLQSGSAIQVCMFRHSFRSSMANKHDVMDAAGRRSPQARRRRRLARPLRRGGGQGLAAAGATACSGVCGRSCRCCRRALKAFQVGLQLEVVCRPVTAVCLRCTIHTFACISCEGPCFASCLHSAGAADRRSRFCLQLLGDMSRRLFLPLAVGQEVVLTVKREPGGILLEVADRFQPPAALQGAAGIRACCALRLHARRCRPARPLRPHGEPPRTMPQSRGLLTGRAGLPCARERMAERRERELAWTQSMAAARAETPTGRRS